RWIESGVLSVVGRFRQKPVPFQEDAVRSFIQRHQSKILGVLSGFDRLVFRGNIRQVAGAKGMMGFLRWHGILLKHFDVYAKTITERVRAAAESTLERAGRRRVEFLASPQINKEERALAIAREDGIT